MICTLLYLFANFHTTSNIFGSMVALVAYVCILVAQQGRVPGLYLPFLMLQVCRIYKFVKLLRPCCMDALTFKGIGIVMYSLATSYLIFLFIAMPPNYSKLMDDRYLQDPNGRVQSELLKAQAAA